MKQAADRQVRGRRTVRGFSLAELLVVLAMLAILISIFVPYLRQKLEQSRRIRCLDNLRQISGAFQNYRQDNNNFFPRVVNSTLAESPSYTAFTGADDPNPFAPGSKVEANDVTASLWLLVRGEYLTDTGVFICPSSGDRRDPMTDASGRKTSPQKRGNFRSPRNLSYSYATPFSPDPAYRLTDTLVGDFAILADKNPGVQPGVEFSAPPLEHARINSRNHGGSGQNVLYSQGGASVTFQQTPYCARNNDNIYTSQTNAAPTTRPAEGLEPSTEPTTMGVRSTDATRVVAGYLGREVWPSGDKDSYLLPTEQDGR